ncbi:MAG: hypothetical protein ABR569_00240 [Gaiellaceae bacterium]
MGEAVEDIRASGDPSAGLLAAIEVTCGSDQLVRLVTGREVHSSHLSEPFGG